MPEAIFNQSIIPQRTDSNAEEASAHGRDEQAKELLRFTQALQDAIDALSDLQSLDEVIPRILQIAAETFETESCAFYTNDTSGMTWLRYWYVAGRTMLPAELMQLDSQKFALIRLLANGFSVPDSYLGQPSHLTIGPVILNHVRGTSVPEFDRFAVGTGWELELNIGVAVKGVRACTLCIYRTLANPFTPQEIDLGISLAKQLGMAMQIARLAEQAQETAIAQDREARSKRISEFLVQTGKGLSEGLSGGKDLTATLGSLLTVLASSINAEHLFLLRHDATTQTLRLAVSYISGRIRWGESGDELPLFADTFPDNITPAWRILCEQRRLLTPDTVPIPAKEFAWPGAFDYVERFGLSDMANMVLFAGDIPIGSIGLGFIGGAKLHTDDMSFIEAAGQQVAIVIRMLDLSEEARQAAVSREREMASQQHAEELAKTNIALKQTLDAVAFEPDLNRVPGHVLAAITKELSSCSGALWLLDKNSGRFTIHLAYHDGEVQEVHADPDVQLRKIWGKGQDLLLKDHIRDRRPIVYQVKNLQGSYPQAFTFLQRLGVQTLLGVPLLLGAEIVGSLTLRFDSQRDVDREELELIQAMAHQATMAIQLTLLAERAGNAARSEERERFAREIHDTLAQGFSGILMQLGAASQIPGDRRSDITTHLQTVASLARSSLAEARRSVRALRSVPDTECRLDITIEQFVERIRLQTSAEVSFRINGSRGILPPHVENELCRIAQEALNNAVKHAAAKKIAVSVEFQGATALRLAIKDDGIGFDPELRPEPGSFGLIGMQERATTIGASFTIISEKGRGAEVIVQYGKAVY